MVQQAATRKWTNIGIGFSGGGLRATLFHLGVICAFRHARLLKHVKLITSVSGGSITAVHVVQNWEQYAGDDDEQFCRAVEELTAFARRDVRSRVLRRWFLSWLLFRVLRRPSLTTLVRAEYDELYRKGALRDLNPASGGRPELHVLTTSLSSGDLCSFDHQGFRYYDRKQAEEKVVNYELPLSLAVAASAAFPPLFPPVQLSPEELDDPDIELTHALSDGGVFDNLGLYRIHQLLAGDATKCDTLVVSDAENAWAWRTDRTFSFIVGRNIRASDLLMKRISDLEYNLIGTTHRPAKIHIGRELDAASEQAPILENGVQRHIAVIRTDLDRFSKEEINALLRHGFCVARNVLKADGFWSVPDVPPWPFMTPITTATRSYFSERNARGLSARVCGLWDWRDWTSYVVVLLLATYIGGFVYQYIKLDVRAEQAILASITASTQSKITATNAIRLVGESTPIRATVDNVKSLNQLNQTVDPTTAERGRQVAEVTPNPGAPLPSGQTVLFDGFKSYDVSSFLFQSASIVPWAARPADLGAANPALNDNASLFVFNDSAPYPPPPTAAERISAGIIRIEGENLANVLSCPDPARGAVYTFHYTAVAVGALYCLRTWNGHFAKLRIKEVGNDRVAFDWVYQPSGSLEFQ